MLAAGQKSDVGKKRRSSPKTEVAGRGVEPKMLLVVGKLVEAAGAVGKVKLLEVELPPAEHIPQCHRHPQKKNGRRWNFQRSICRTSQVTLPHIHVFEGLRARGVRV